MYYTLKRLYFVISIFISLTIFSSSSSAHYIQTHQTLIDISVDKMGENNASQIQHLINTFLLSAHLNYGYLNFILYDADGVQVASSSDTQISDDQTGVASLQVVLWFLSCFFIVLLPEAFSIITTHTYDDLNMLNDQAQ